MSNTVKLENLQADLDSVDTSAFDGVTEDSNKVGASVGAVTPEQFGSIYPAVRAVLVALSAMWFLPAKFKSILEVLLKYLDSLTGTV